MDRTLPHLKDSRERILDSYWTRILAALDGAGDGRVVADKHTRDDYRSHIVTLKIR